MKHTNKSIILVLLKNNGKIEHIDNYGTVSDFTIVVNNYTVNVYKNHIWDITNLEGFTKSYCWDSGYKKISSLLNKIVNKELFLE